MSLHVSILLKYRKRWHIKKQRTDELQMHLQESVYQQHNICSNKKKYQIKTSHIKQRHLGMIVGALP